jgi:hypothetical protein
LLPAAGLIPAVNFQALPLAELAVLKNNPAWEFLAARFRLCGSLLK